jgi:hypothetical protein
MTSTLCVHIMQFVFRKHGKLRIKIFSWGVFHLVTNWGILICSDTLSIAGISDCTSDNFSDEFCTFTSGSNQQPAIADFSSCPGRCECRQLSSPMCHSSMWRWRPLCAWDGLLHMWMCTRLSWHTVPAACCPYHATGHTNPEICWEQLPPL